MRQSNGEMQEGKLWDHRQGAGRKSQPRDVSVRDTTAQRNTGRETQREKRKNKTVEKREAKRGTEVDGGPGRD